MRLFRRRRRDDAAPRAATDEMVPGRVHREVQVHLPGYVDEALPRWRRRLVRAHLKRCELCTMELERQRSVSAGLETLEETVTTAAEVPPAGLLDTLLEQAEKPGVRARAAVPVRGAVSGARPGLSVILLLVAAAAGTAAGYGTWRAIGVLRGLLRSAAGHRLGRK